MEIYFSDGKVYLRSVTKIAKERKQKGKSIIAFPEKFIVFDIETTGLSPDFDEIIEFCGILVENGHITDRFSTLIRPEEKIDAFIENLTGITNDMLSTAPSVETVLPRILSFLGDYILVGHNVSFDVNFLYDACVNQEQPPLKNDFIDTMRISRKLYPDLAHHRLQDIVAFLDVPKVRSHRAENDCIMTLSCFQRMHQDVLSRYASAEEFGARFKRKSHSRPLNPKEITTEKSEFDETHPLFGKVCVFTGALDRMNRREAMQIVVDCGGICAASVTKKTNYLILGNNDYCKTIKDGKSAKQKKAEELLLKGQAIEIIPENVFYDMLSDQMQ